MENSKLNKLKKNDRTVSKKRQKTEANIIIHKKKTKIERKVELPNELWMKIMHFLPTKDILTSFALVNKHFYDLTLSSGSIKCLSIKDIENDFDFDKVIEVVNRSKGLKELSIMDCPQYWQRFVFRSIQTSISLYTLKISLTLKEHQYQRVPSQQFFSPIPKSVLFTPALMDMIISGQNHLESLEFNGLCLPLEVTRKIGQLQHLKSLRILNVDSTVMILGILTTLAQNCHKLETIEIHRIYEQFQQWPCDCDSLKDAFKIFIEKNQRTLQNIMLDVCFMCDSLRQLSFHHSNVLEELKHGINDLNFVIDKFQGTLKKLILRKESPRELEEILSAMTQMNLPNLKYLAIHGTNENYGGKSTSKLFQSLTKNQFPCLERLYVNSDRSPYVNTPLALATFKRLITKSIKSIQFDGTSVSEINVPNKYLCDLFTKSGIFIVFGKVKETKFYPWEKEKESKIRKKQKEFEEYLKRNHSIWEKYQTEKHIFAKWCRKNQGYGY